MLQRILLFTGLAFLFPWVTELTLGQQSAKPSFQSAKIGDERDVSGVKLRWCPPGRFVMGSPTTEPERRADESQVEVQLSKGFWMGKYEVTQGQWKQLIGAFPRPQPPDEGDDFPVVEVSYLEVETFCQKLTELGHRSGVLPPDWKIALPTEAQWEYACRAGTTTASASGNQLSVQQANILADDQPPSAPVAPGRGLKHATPVGTYPANAWGLYDMHGNVFE